MSKRIGFVEPPAPIHIELDGEVVEAYEGESVAALLVLYRDGMSRHDRDGDARGLWCNMGTCSECFVRLLEHGRSRRVRACLLEATDGMRIATGSHTQDD